MTQRMKQIAAAAARLFLCQGYAGTQISHIAKAVGVSVGTIYLDFTGKKEILHFILKCTIDPSFGDRSLERPLTDDLFAGLEEEIIALFDALGRDFASHLEGDAADYDFESLLSDSFDLLSRYAVGCLFIEKNHFEFPRLARHYMAYRRQFLDTMMDYLRIFIARGTVRPLEHLELTATLMVETLSWWAMDLRYTTFEPRDISPELAKQVCLDNLLAAYRR